VRTNLDIVGVWSMIAWRQHRGDQTVLPLGDLPVGFIVYTRDGFVSVNIMRRGRPQMMTGDFVSASDEEKAVAFAGYMGYCGRYELTGDMVVHHIQAASYPNWIGDRQQRRISWDGQILRLSTSPRDVNGVKVTAVIEWKRWPHEAGKTPAAPVLEPRAQTQHELGSSR